MSKQTEWLFAELERWLKERIITPDQAERIRALYAGEHARNDDAAMATAETPRDVRGTGEAPAGAKRKPGVPWGLVVFSGLGAVVVGLGVILLLAYNWSEIPKFGKLGIIFGATAAAHTAGLRFRRMNDWRAGLGEVFSLLGSMLFGAGIWLVAQVYHIDEHFPSGFLFWGLGALALAWALGSVPQALLATVTLTIWACTETFGFREPNAWAAALLIVGVGGLVWLKRSAVLTAAMLAALYVLLLSNAGFWWGGAGVFTSALSLSVLLVGVARSCDGEFARVGAVAAFLGWIGFLLCAYVLSFHDAVQGLLRWRTYGHEHAGAAVWIYSWGFFGLAGVVWAGLVVKRLRGGEAVAVKMEEWLCPIALVYGQGLVLVGLYGAPEFVAAVFNLVILGIATAWMVRGCRAGTMRRVVLGSLVLAALVFARYFDLFDSLAARGLAFLVLGGVLFAEGFFYRKLRGADPEGGAS